MDDYFIFLIALVTTAAGWWITRKILGASGISFADAVRRLMECVGAFVVFLIVNMTIGVTMVLLIRSTTSRFVSIYLLDDYMVVLLSAVQGVLFSLWWSDRQRRSIEP